MLQMNKKDPNKIPIVMTRDSVCMGDDCMAPHEEEILFETSDTLYELLNRTASYVPAMRYYEWSVMCDTEVLGRLVSGSGTKYQIILDQPNRNLSALPEYEIFCRHRQLEKPEVMNFCPNCGRKNAGGRYCAECGTNLEW